MSVGPLRGYSASESADQKISQQLYINKLMEEIVVAFHSVFPAYRKPMVVGLCGYFIQEWLLSKSNT